MARFSLGGDDEGEEGPSNNRPLPKKPRTSDPIVSTPKRANPPAASTSNSGGRSAAGNAVSALASSQRPVRQAVRLEAIASVNEDTEAESNGDSDTAYSGSSGEELSSESEYEDEELLRNQQCGGEVQPTEAQVNSNNTAIGTKGESPGEMPAPISVTLTDPDVLDCPICLEPLGSPVYQCENGHIACASCCIKMRNKCGSCCWPIGYNRCRAIEKVIESIRVSCKYTHHGCMESLNFSKKLEHEKTCSYAPCSCPHVGCNYVGVSKGLYTHFALEHPRSSKQFLFNSVITISLDSFQKHVFLQEIKESILFVLNRSIEPFGSRVNVVCIAPNSSKKGFLYDITAQDGESLIKLKTAAESTLEWDAHVPAKRYLFVPSDFTCSGQLKLELTIWRGL